MTYRFRPQGVCSQEMVVEYDENRVITDLKVFGGCRGNLQGISKLVVGYTIDEVISRLEGIECRGGTSCPDQLAKGLKNIK